MMPNWSVASLLCFEPRQTAQPFLKAIMLRRWAFGRVCRSANKG